jgi:GNAT superfamily N-acetyltransferase
MEQQGHEVVLRVTPVSVPGQPAPAPNREVTVERTSVGATPLPLRQALASAMSRVDPWERFHYTERDCFDAISVGGLEADLYTAHELPGGPVGGFAHVAHHGSLGGPCINYLCVLTRGKGIGTRLLLEICQTDYPLECIHLTVSQGNEPARKLYERLGFAYVGVLPDYNRPNEAEYVMELSRGPRRDSRPRGQGD